MLPKKHRLKNKEDFQRVYKKGRFFSLNGIAVGFLDNEYNYSRFGFVVGKNFSKDATSRNRARRILRSAISKLIDRLEVRKDFVISAKKQKEDNLKYSEVASCLEEGFRKNKLIK